MHVLQRRSPLFLVVFAVLIVSVAIGPAHAVTRSVRARAKVLALVNRYRQQHGLAKLRENKAVDRTARRHSATMASQRRLFHSADLQSKLRTHHPSTWGENVGMGPSVWRVFKAWTRSSEHRANMLNRRFDHVGIGVVFSHGYYWITTIFYG
jgi:uncharacterized protein YkwD